MVTKHSSALEKHSADEETEWHVLLRKKCVVQKQEATISPEQSSP